MDHDPVTIHPASISALSIDSHPDVDLWAKTTIPIPFGSITRRESVSALVIIDSKKSLVLWPYGPEKRFESWTISWSLFDSVVENREGWMSAKIRRSQT